MCPHYFVRIVNKPPTFNPLWTVEDLWVDLEGVEFQFNVDYINIFHVIAKQFLLQIH